METPRLTSMRTLRNTSILLAALTSAVGCAVKNAGTSPPLDSFFYPVSVALGPTAGGTPDGVLYVASSNFDLRYNRGTVLAVDLQKVRDANSGKLDGAVNQAVDSANGYALIDNFAGQMLVYQKSEEPGAARTLFVTSRAANALYPLQALGARLSCPVIEGGEQGGQDCIDQGIAVRTSDQVRAENAFGLALRKSTNTLFITHVQQADQPAGSGNNRSSFLFELDADNPTAAGIQAVDLGANTSPAESIVDAGPARGLYFTGRYIGTGSQALRELLNNSVVVDANLTANTTIQEAHGLGISSDRTRLFVATSPGNRTLDPLPPEGLVIVDISEDPTSGAAANRVLGFVSLPAGASFVQVIPRVGKRDLVAVSCTQGNAVALYDDDLGQLAAVVNGVQEPYGMAASPASRTTADEPVTLFVASFGNDTVDVIQIQRPESEPRDSTIAGRLGYPAHRPLGVPIP
jgi:hypothetical protein